ncbi:MAG: hypothetical protein MN733_28540 [Nitrososphaera sp.]|nr:hypothetical protein [Nitrososphaera sp.]
MKVEMYEDKYLVVMGDHCVIGGPYDTESEAMKRIDEITYEIIDAFETAGNGEVGLNEDKVVEVIMQLAISMKEKV